MSNSTTNPVTVPVRLRLAGAFGIFVDGEPVDLHVTGSTCEALARLCTQVMAPTRREALADEIWPDLPLERSRAALNTALWRIRRVIAAVPGVELVGDRTSIFIHLSEPAETDATALERSLAGERVDRADRMRGLARALEGQGGRYLEGIDAEWASVERRRLEQLRSRARSSLIRLLTESRRYQEAIALGLEILEEDPYCELVVRQLMWLNAMTGQRVRAVALYRDFVQRMDEEMGMGPEPETVALVGCIRAGADPAPGAAAASLSSEIERATPGRFEDWVETLQDSRRSLYASLEPGDG